MNKTTVSKEEKEKFNSEVDRIMAIIDKSREFERYSSAISELEKKEKREAYLELLDQGRTLLCRMWLGKCVEYCMRKEDLSVSTEWIEMVKEVPRITKRWRRFWRTLAETYNKERQEGGVS